MNASEYLESLIVPEDKNCEIPDTETRSVVLTNSAVNKTFNVSDGLIDEFVVFQPKYEGRGLVWRGAAKPRPVYPATSLVPGNNSPVIVPIEDLGQSRDLAQSYTYARPTSAVCTVNSAAISTTNAALAGTMTAVSVADMRDIVTTTPAALAQIGITSQDSVSSVPSYDGVRLITGPEVVGGLRALETTVKQNTCQTKLKFGTSTLTTPILEMYAPPYCMNSSGTVDFQLNKNGAVAIVELRAVYVRLEYNSVAKTYDEKFIAVLLGQQTMAANFISMVSASFMPPDDGFLYQLRSIQYSGTAGDAISRVVLTIDDYEDSSNHHWCGVVCLSGFSTQSPVTVAARLNFEAVPDATLRIDYKPDARRWGVMNMSDLTMASAMFNSKSSPIKRVWRISEFANFKDTGVARIVNAMYANQPLLMSAQATSKLLDMKNVEEEERGEPNTNLASPALAAGALASPALSSAGMASPVGDIIEGIAKSILPPTVVDIGKGLLGPILTSFGLAAPAVGYASAAKPPQYYHSASGRSRKRVKLCAPTSSKMCMPLRDGSLSSDIGDDEPPITHNPSGESMAAPATAEKSHRRVKYELTTSKKTYSPDKCLDPSDVISEAETGWGKKLRKYLAGKPAKTGNRAAKIVTVETVGGKDHVSVEYITITDKAVKTVSTHGSFLPTTYTTLKVTCGTNEHKVMVSEDLVELSSSEAADARQAGDMTLYQIALVTALAELNDVFITGPVTGAIGGDSFGAALFLAAMGVCPDKVVLSGGLAASRARTSLSGLGVMQAGKLYTKYLGIMKNYPDTLLVCHPQESDPLMEAYVKQPPDEAAGLATVLAIEGAENTSGVSCFLANSITDVITILLNTSTQVVTSKTSEELEAKALAGKAKAEKVAKEMLKYGKLPKKKKKAKTFTIESKFGTEEVPLLNFNWWAEHAEGAIKAKIMQEAVKRHIAMGNVSRLQGMAMAVLNNMPSNSAKKSGKQHLKVVGDVTDVGEPTKKWKPQKRQPPSTGTPFQRAFQQPQRTDDPITDVEPEDSGDEAAEEASQWEGEDSESSSSESELEQPSASYRRRQTYTTTATAAKAEKRKEAVRPSKTSKAKRHQRESLGWKN